ncbi:hypothetical protein [Streptomyces sp. KR80]|uniref:hypothetical protein n=1 Tax=Streptomyces sp. KR80 TaxID=3457426 RepID=UPI003FD3F1CE
MTISAELPLHARVDRSVPLRLPSTTARTATERTPQSAPGLPTEPGRPAEESPAVSVPALDCGVSSPIADCIADSAGGLTFDLADCGPSGAPETWDTSLVLRRRDGDGDAEEVRLPLVQTGGGRLRAVLPSTMELPEGRWDVYAPAAGDGGPQRTVPGVLDLRSLVDRRPDSDRPTVAVRIPYATKHANLSVRSWLRAPHAEAGEIRLTDSGITVEGRLYGAAVGPGALAEARCRRDPSLVRTAPVSVEGAAAFAFTFSLKELAEDWEGDSESWDLWLRPDADAEPARIARLLDDVPDKQDIFCYPAQPLAAPQGSAEVGPYYTTDNDLAVRIDPAGGAAA